MNKTRYFDLLRSIIAEEDGLLTELGEGQLNKDKFHIYTNTVFELSKLELSDKERTDAIILIWQISHLIQDYLISHFDPNDVYIIENLENDDRRQLQNILYYVPNWFSYKKVMDLNDLKIGSWK